MNKIKIFRDEGWRIFVLAILASLVWHLFWLSTIAIISNPTNARSAKFSKVSFLGPLLGKSSMELQARPKERSFLEMRYLGEARRLSQTPAQAIATTADKYEDGNDDTAAPEHGFLYDINPSLHRPPIRSFRLPVCESDSFLILSSSACISRRCRSPAPR